MQTSGPTRIGTFGRVVGEAITILDTAVARQENAHQPGRQGRGDEALRRQAVIGALLLVCVGAALAAVMFRSGKAHAIGPPSTWLSPVLTGNP